MPRPTGYSEQWYSRKWFESFPKIKAWIYNIRSEHTKMHYLKYLRAFCTFYEIDDPENILEKPIKEIRRLIEEFQDNHNDNKAKNIKIVMKSLLKFFDMKLDFPVFEGRDEHGRYIQTEKNYEKLAENETISYWIEDYKSTHTRKQYLFFMDKFLTKFDLTPNGLLELPIKKVKNLLKQIRSEYIKQDKLSMANRFNSVLKSFFEVYEMPLHFTKKEKIKLVRKRKAYIPTKSEIYKLIDVCSNLRNKAIFLCLFQSGVRISCLKRWTYGMVKNYLYPKIKVPVRLEITSAIDTKLKSYDLTHYYSFLQDEAVSALKTYLCWRKDVYNWQPKDSDLLFVANTGDNRPVSISNLNESLKRVAKKVGIKPEEIWIHCLRKAFRKVLYKSEIDPDLAEALMGHRIEGSRHNYFDYHDMNWIEDQYTLKCNFSREGVGLIEYLQDKVKQQDGLIKKLQTELHNLRERTKQQMDELMERLIKLNMNPK